MGVDDDMTDMTWQDAIEAIVDEAPQESSVVGVSVSSVVSSLGPGLCSSL
jgi:hypothetical protein